MSAVTSSRFAPVGEAVGCPNRAEILFPRRGEKGDGHEARLLLEAPDQDRLGLWPGYGQGLGFGR